MIEVKGCTSRYDAGNGLILECRGEHVTINIFRPPNHSAQYGNLLWFWQDKEAIQE